VNNGAVVTGFAQAGNAVTYTITSPGATWGASAQGAYTVSLASSVQDNAGNPVAANASFASFVVDTIAPTATLTTPPPAFINASAAGSNTTTLTVSYADGGTGINAATFGTSNITVNNGAVVTGFAQAGNAVTYTITSPGASWGASAQGTYTVSLASSVQDNAGNPVAANASFASFVVDTIAPTATLTTPPPAFINASAAGTNTTSLTVTYADAGSGINTATFGTSNITVNNGAVVTGFAPVGNAVTYTITSPGATWGASAQGTYTVSLASSVRDNAGNSVAASASFASFVVDTIAPTATLTTPPPAFINLSAAGTNTTSLTVTYADGGSGINAATFSTSNITVNNGAVVTGFAQAGNAVTYTITSPGATWGASAQGTYTVSLASSVTDAAGNPVAANANLTSFVVDTIAPNVAIGLPSTTLASTGPVTYTVTYTDANNITGTLGAGNVTLNKGGTADGMVNVSAPTGQGTTTVSYTVTISNITGSGTLGISLQAGTVTDVAGNPAGAAGPSATFKVNNVTVNPPATTFTAQIGVSFNQTFTGSGGTSPYALTLTGSTPAGLTFSGGVLSGTPTEAGTFSFSVKATDSTSAANGGPYSGSTSYNLTVNPPNIVLPTTMPDATAGVAYSQSVVATGGTAPYTYSIVGGSLPPFMNMNSAGLITGTPHGAGTYTVNVKAVDHSTGTGAPFSATQSIQLVVHAGAAAKIVFLSQPKLFGTAVGTFLPLFKVELLDKYGNVTDGTVSLRLLPVIAFGASKFTANSVTQKATVSGVATFDKVAVNTAGLFVIQAQVGTVNGFSGLFIIGTFH
jgi:hypothetical protein